MGNVFAMKCGRGIALGNFFAMKCRRGIAVGKASNSLIRKINFV